MSLHYIERTYSLKSKTPLKIGRQDDHNVLRVTFTDFDMLNENSIMIINVDVGLEENIHYALFDNKVWEVPAAMTKFAGTLEGQLIELLLDTDNKTIIQERHLRKFDIYLGGSIPLNGEFQKITPEFELWINQYKDDHKNIVALMDSIQAKLDSGFFNGKDGAQGPQGEQGPPGENGKDGKDGLPGKEIHIENPYDDKEIKEELSQQSERLNNIKESQPQSGVIYYNKSSLRLQLNGDSYDLNNDFNDVEDSYLGVIVNLLQSGINLIIVDTELMTVGLFDGLISGLPSWSNEEVVWVLSFMGFLRTNKKKKERVTYITNQKEYTDAENLIETVGIPEYIDEANLSLRGLTKTGWYVFAKIKPPKGIEVSEPIVEGVEKYLYTYSPTGLYLDVSVLFGASPESQVVTVYWNNIDSERFIFKATDLAIRNLDYRITYYVYDIKPYAEYEFAKTKVGDRYGTAKKYFRLINNEYVLADDVPYGNKITESDEELYYHSKLTFRGFTRNVSYTSDEIDCPVTIYMPEVNDDNYGCWFEIQTTFSGAFSVTFVPAEGSKLSQSTVTAPTEGINMINAQYHAKTKTWFMTNTVWKKASE